MKKKIKNCYLNWKTRFENAKKHRQKIKSAKELAAADTLVDAEAAIQIHHLTMPFKVKFGTYKYALDDVSFTIKKGQFHGFIGDNGAGKTTTIRSILGFYSNYIGKIFINSELAQLEKTKLTIGYIPEVALFPKQLTIREYLIAMARISKIPSKDVIRRVDALLADFGFNTSEFNKSPSQMSSGQKKKIMLMQALLSNPDILIMDEPVANLDPTARNDFYQLIKKLNQAGKTIFISSHILLELEQYIDSYTILKDGKVLESGILAEKNKNIEYNYILELNDNKQILGFLHARQIQYKQNEKNLEVKLTDRQKFSLLGYIAVEKIELIKFSENKFNIDQVFFKGYN
ncbi:ABC transporter ATP-binding protein [Mycoplasmopsis columbinasalis]|uniref:ABC transporter ATP-binding protein n=1 Tax=Mycoplasmopsis columbinasalis TaxID=114880 RepID=A0A449BAR8_9BACT|nr:ABC transporter ATP-binding protein [Mycoplasmopsis columbinasalis]VEU78286.1 ABC transporter ATP-binding protein [Mycoplasmopsis columbinasalis]